MHLSDSQQHYLVKTKQNISYHFYLNKNHEINYTIYNNSGIFVKKEKLLAEIILDFSVVINDKNQIHIICITKCGNLLYYIGLDNHWSHKSISTLDIKSNQYKYLSLILLDNVSHIFCLKTNLLNSMVSSIEHIYWDDKKLNKSTITSYLPGKYPSPFKIDIDSMNNLHIICKVFYKENHQLYYSKFNSINNKWSKTELISNLQDDHSHPSLLIDKKNNLHLVWCVIEKNNFTLRYKKKMDVMNQRSTWSKTITLSSRNTNSLAPLLLQEGDMLKVLSKQNNCINEIISQNYGSSWSPVPSSNKYKTVNPILIQYSTNNEVEKKNYKLRYAYSEINKSIYLFGTKLYATPNDTMDITNRTYTSSEQEEIRETDLNNTLQLNTNYIDDAEKETHDTLEFIEKNNSNNLEKPTADFSPIFQDIEVYVDKLIIELEKLQEIKNFLKKESILLKDSEDFTNSLPPLMSNHLKKIESQLTQIHKEKIDIQEDINKINAKFSVVESKIHQCMEKYSNIYDVTKQYSYKNSSFLSRIKEIFK